MIERSKDWWLAKAQREGDGVIGAGTPIDEATVERAARALERQRKAPYGWTDEQFELWFTRDPAFVKHVTVWGNGFHGTRKEQLFHEVRTVLGAAGVMR